MSNMFKICFLFGAGADNNYDNNIPMGKQFAKELLLDREHNPAIKKFYQDKIKSVKGHAGDDEKDWLPEDFNPAAFKLSSLVRASVRKKCAGSGETKEEIAAEIKTELKKTKEEQEELVAQYPNYINQIDGRMHTIIRPKAFGTTSFCAVISLYARAYIIMCNKILGEKAKELLEHYSDIVGDLDNVELKDVNSYYHVVKELKETIKETCVVTTNYTPFAEKIIGLDDKSISYPHGKLGWFEDPYRLEVYDAAENSDKPKIQSRFVFPYIFLQSGVKPIVDPKQIDEYKKTKDFLTGSELVFICGYGINEDDNHLNSLLRHRIKNGKTTIYVDYYDQEKASQKDKNKTDAEISNDKKIDILRKLRIGDTSNKDFHVEIIKKASNKEDKKSASDVEQSTDDEQLKKIINRYC